MALEQTRQKFRELLKTIGKAGLNGAFPNDFEYYACSFELLDWKGDVVDLLIFPVLPSNYREIIKKSLTIKKSSSAVISLFNPSFIPSQITLSGNFGRMFRVLAGRNLINFKALLFNNNYGAKEFVQDFNTSIKTGYGVAKTLQNILERSFQVDNEGRTYSLIFTNLAFNSSFVVEPINYEFFINEQKNRIWEYNVSLQTIAPAFSIRKNNGTSNLKLLAFDNLQKSSNILKEAGLKKITDERQKLFK